MLVHHPDDDEALLITGSELMVLVVPLDDLDLPRVPLKVLVHGQISTTLTLASVQLQHFEQAGITTASDVSFLLVPPNHIQVRAIWHTNLKC